MQEHHEPDPARQLRAQLHEAAKDRGEPFDAVLHRYARDTLLRRLLVSPLGEHLAVRGGSALAARLGVEHRRLRGVDLLFTGDGGLDHVVAGTRLVMGPGDDGLRFDEASLRFDLRHDVARGGELDGVSGAGALRLAAQGFAYRERSQVPFRLDIALGAAVPAPEPMDLETVLGDPLVDVLVVRFETIVAEALARIVAREPRRRRMTDFYDAWLAAQVDPLDELASAVRGAFARVGVPLPEEVPHGLSDRWASSAHPDAQWDAFLERGGVAEPVGFEVVVVGLRDLALDAFEEARAA